MSSFLFLTCCFLIIIACSEGANTDAKKLETRQTCSTDDFPSGCTLPSKKRKRQSTNSELNQLYSRICTKPCVDAITEYYRCLYSEQEQEYIEYQVNYIQKYRCGQHSNGDYCEVQILNVTTNYTQVFLSCPRSSVTGLANTAISCSSGTPAECTNALSTFSSYMGCCTEPLLGPGVRSCSGVSVPEACTGVSASSTGESSATGITATAPIVAVSLMVFALVGVLL